MQLLFSGDVLGSRISQRGRVGWDDVVARVATSRLAAYPAVALIACLSSGLAAAPCAHELDESRRLDCYDEFHDYAKPGAQKAGDESDGSDPVGERPVAPGVWDVYRGTSELTDERTVMLATSAYTSTNCGRLHGWGRVQVVLRCKENTTSLYLRTHCHLTDHAEYGKVDWRVDKKPRQILRMDESTDKRALGLWSGSRSIPVIKRMLGGKRLTVRFTPYGENSKTASFPIANLKSAIKPLRAACHW